MGICLYLFFVEKIIFLNIFFSSSIFTLAFCVIIFLLMFLLEHFGPSFLWLGIFDTAFLTYCFLLFKFWHKIYHSTALFSPHLSSPFSPYFHTPLHNLFVVPFFHIFCTIICFSYIFCFTYFHYSFCPTILHYSFHHKFRKIFTTF